MFSKVILKPTSSQQTEVRRVEGPKGGFCGSLLKVMHITFSHISLAQILLMVTPKCRGAWGILFSCVSWWKEKQIRQTLSQPLPHCPRPKFQPIGSIINILSIVAQQFSFISHKKRKLQSLQCKGSLILSGVIQ